MQADLSSKKTVKWLLEKHGAAALKRLGQNFLVDRAVLGKIVKAAESTQNDIVLEIGPGLGTLTQELAKEAKKVIAIEKDAKMCEILKETLKDFNNIEIINTDVLKFINLKLEIKNFKIVANIPYYLTSPLIRMFLESENPPELMVLLIQKEVAQRICSKPPKMNLLAVSVQFYAEPKIVSYVSKNSFWPKPKVDSALIKISQIHTNLPQLITNLFFKIVKAGFSQPRKQLVNNLSKELKLNKEKTASWLLKNNIKPEQRAETLSVDDWLLLVNSFL